MIFALFTVIILDLLFARLFGGLFNEWKRASKDLEQISEITTKRDRLVWFILYVLESITIFIVVGVLNIAIICQALSY